MYLINIHSDEEGDPWPLLSLFSELSALIPEHLPPQWPSPESILDVVAIHEGGLSFQSSVHFHSL